ncbi:MULTISPECIES: hypothetical protein [Bacillus cereus group]|uniref:hypothetical protein n=1 Tax=Bacillus cereus group TaxID=86661 RepID=UPI0013C37184|nr:MULTISPECIES: hypothetical protein [Bacillus cereus group]QUG99301.1 hypothetical protein HCM98_31315 [Bacillus tropicus]
MYNKNLLVSMTGLASINILNLLDAPLVTIGIAIILAFITNFSLIIHVKRKMGGNK